MKNVKLIFTSLLMSALIFSTSMASANTFGVVTHIQVVDQANGDKSISVQIPYSNTPKVKVKLEDADGLTLYSKNVKGENGFAKLLNVNDLPNGVYYIVVEDNNKITKQAFRIDSEQIVLNDYKEEVIQKPTFQYNARRQLVLLNTVADGVIEVNIQDDNGNNLLMMEENNQFEKAFNLENLNRGTYTFIMKYGGKTFYENVTIK